MPQARTRLGELHYLGRGVPESDATAYALFSAGAGGGDPAAMFWLGRMHLLGHAPAGDASEADRDAARWFFEAARRGHAEAQYYLGILFMAGTGVQRDEREAQKWMRRAAAGSPGAAAVPARARTGMRQRREAGRSTNCSAAAPGLPAAALSPADA